MRLRLDIRPRADRDIADLAEHIAGDNIDAAIKFLHSVRSSMEFLTTMPKAGPEYPILSNDKLTGLRKWSVNGYRHYLIFYRVTDDTIEIIRIIHGARDIPTLLAEEGTAS